MESTLWQSCLSHLKRDLTTQQFNTWILPIHAIENESSLRLLAPNQFVLDWVSKRYLEKITEISSKHFKGSAESCSISFEVGSVAKTPVLDSTNPDDTSDSKNASPLYQGFSRKGETKKVVHVRSLRGEFTFDSFVEGKSNQLAKAASLQVCENPGNAYNPLFIYGGVGLGKTHLMQAVGNQMVKNKTDSSIVYIHSERFVGDMVRAFQHNTINEFKRYYRSVDALLIDDIQFFANKERSQEEFFHTFNTLLEGQSQIIMTCDRYPKEVGGLEERLKSRFGWGLTVSIDPPEMETCAAILMSKAESVKVNLPDEVAFFIAKHVRSNVRELEGALRRVCANAKFTGQPITIELAKETLRDLLAIQDKIMTIDNIKKTVADYCKIRATDLVSKRRSRSVARPRQMAMSLAKEFTNHSLPEIGDAFGGRDHTTVIHACKKIQELRETENKIKEDYSNLTRILTT